MKATLLLFFAAAMAFLPLGLRGQSPVPAIPPQVSASVAPAAVVSPDNASVARSTLKLLQEMKAANEATLKTQATELATLDDLQKAAEEIKIYSKRG